MSPRAAAAVLLALAALLWAGVALPARQSLPGLEQEIARTRADGERLRERLAEVERHEEARARMATAFSASLSRADLATELRQSLVSVLDRAKATNVRLSVARAEPPVAAQARLSADGSFAELVRLSGLLSRPGGLVLEEVRFEPTPTGLSLRLEGIALEPRR